MTSTILKYSLSKVIPAMLSFVALALFTSALGPTEYGKLSLLNTYIAYSFGFFLVWPNHCLSRFGVGSDANAWQCMKWLFVSIGILIVVFIFWVLGGGEPRIALLIAVSAMVQSFSDFCFRFLNVRGQENKFLFQSILRPTVYIVCGLCFIHTWGNSHVVLAFALVCAFIVSILPQLKFLIASLFGNHNLKGRITLKESLMYSFPLISASGSLLVFDTMDRFVLKKVVGEEVLGGYLANFELIGFFISSLFNVGFLVYSPMLFRASDIQDIVQITRMKVQFFLGFATPIAWGLVLAGDEVLVLLSGSSYQLASPWIASVLAFSAILLGLKASFLDSFLMNRNKTGWVFAFNLLAIALKAFLMWILIPRYGELGAAISGSGALLVVVLAILRIEGRTLIDEIWIFASSKYFRLTSSVAIVWGVVAMLLGGVWRLVVGVCFGVSWIMITYFTNWLDVRSRLRRKI